MANKLANKIYTAFISSAFTSLRDERNISIDCILDYRILPIGMEHFTVSTSGEFSDIEELIDESDFFIMLLGATYGSRDSSGISWSEREYIYAKQKNKPMVVIICKELAALRRKPAEELTEDEKRQVDFANSIGFAREASEEFGIKTIISQFFNTYNFSKCRGWERVNLVESDTCGLEKWRNENQAFDLGGTWYHVHLSDEDLNYIRTGTIKIDQDFTPESYLDLRMEGSNYSVVYYDASTGELKENKMKFSRFVGEYKMQENGEIFGIFNSKRAFSDEFASVRVSGGTRRGIHDFLINAFDGRVECIEGEFHDEAPSPKFGRLYLFRDINERNAFVLENRGDAIVQK